MNQRQWIAILTIALMTTIVSSADARRAADTKRAAAHSITFDSRSLLIDGRRVFIWAGEMHPFRLPSPGLWRDVLQKMKANGYNAVSFYFDWGYHTSKPGVYDFTGVRDMDRVLRIAAEEGLYVIARPGPYMNAEVTRGGFPSWLVTQAARARTDAPEYMAAADEWLTQINAIISRHQLTNGGGSVILYQIENELAVTNPTHARYMRHLYDKVRADGITVPIFHNDQGRNGYWVPKSSNVPDTVPGPIDLYAFDGYPGGTCNVDAMPGTPNVAPDWGFYGPGGAKGGASASPATPGFVAEFGGGWFDYWGSNGTYPCTAIRKGPGYQRVFYTTNIANGLTLQGFYMTFGGTSWGWMPAQVVYTSYDYGAAIDEARRLRPKATTMKQMGQFLQAVTPIVKMEKAAPVIPSSQAIKIYHNTNPDTGTHFYFAMHNPSNGVTNDAFSFPLSTQDGNYTVPQKGTLRINGQDAKTFVAAYDLERQRLVYSTSEIQTHLRQGDTDIALLYGRDGEDGETVLRYAHDARNKGNAGGSGGAPSIGSAANAGSANGGAVAPEAPQITILSGEVASSFDAATGDLRLNYVHGALARVRITGGGRAPLLLLLAGEGVAQTFWRQDTAAGAVLERGTALVRTAKVRGASLALTGDTEQDSELEVWAPQNIRSVTWNGASVASTRTNSGSLLANSKLAGPATITLPDLTQTAWRFKAESPEADPKFDDSQWRVTDATRTHSTTKPPNGQPVLNMDDYGFHHGDVWYRGRYKSDGSLTSVSLHYGGGGAGLMQVWLDGVFLGQDEIVTGLPMPPTMNIATFNIPEKLRAAGDHVFAIQVRNNSHNWDLFADDQHKEGRGLISASLNSNSGRSFAAPIQWKIQGNQGGEDITDKVRGVYNNGGLHGEREGWHLPGYADKDWAKAAVPDSRATLGTSWYRTEFDLKVPAGHDASLGLAFGDPTIPRSTNRYRVLIFVNGWHMGQFIAHIGPQRVFILPDGILNPRGHNTLALAVTSDGAPTNTLEKVQLVNLKTVRGGVPLGE
jgi:beta-galactosidase GanA